MHSMPSILEKKRDGQELTKNEFKFICENIDSIPREQLGAFLMACQINGLSKNETSDLTKSMLNAGQKMTPAPNRVDKHSTGGVGDKMSIILAHERTPFLMKNTQNEPLQLSRFFCFLTYCRMQMYA